MKNFDEIYSEYYDTVFRYVLSMTGDRQWAEEITQESFFKALKDIGTFRGGECKLSVWLCQIAKNTFCTEIRKNKRQEAEMPTEVSGRDEIEKKLCDRETRERQMWMQCIIIPEITKVLRKNPEKTLRQS